MHLADPSTYPERNPSTRDGKAGTLARVSGVELTNVTKTYGNTRALVKVSARFQGGLVSVVLGPNGSGKSTLLAIVGTLMRATSGKVSHGVLGKTRADVRKEL